MNAPIQTTPLPTARRISEIAAQLRQSLRFAMGEETDPLAHLMRDDLAGRCQAVQIWADDLEYIAQGGEFVSDSWGHLNRAA